MQSKPVGSIVHTVTKGYGNVYFNDSFGLFRGYVCQILVDVLMSALVPKIREKADLSHEMGSRPSNYTLAWLIA